MSLTEDLRSLILEYIKQPIPQNTNMPIMEQSIPVPFFGDIENAHIATISINPSNREFENDKGTFLSGSDKRFTDRELLGVKDTDFLSDRQSEEVYASLMNYFHKNPYYKGWFRTLDNYAGSILGGSYDDGTMVHLDIYPWATKQKWNNLSVSEKKNALQKYNLLKKILLNRNFKYIYINGKQTKEQMEKYFDITISEFPITNTKHKANHIRYMYKYKLGNTLLIGSSCYLQNSYESKEYLKELHDILSKNL